MSLTRAEQRELAAADRHATEAAPGDRMPDGNLLDVAGQPTTLAAALSSRPGVIVFYRGGWCPYCNIALRAYQAQLVPALAEQGISLVAISPQSPDSDGARAAQLQLGLDLTKVNADGTTTLPMPTVIIVDSAGVVRWIDVHADYTSRTEPDQVLRAIAQIIG